MDPRVALSGFAERARDIIGRVFDAGLQAGRDRRTNIVGERTRAVDFAADVLTVHAELLAGRALAAAGQEAIDG